MSYCPCNLMLLSMPPVGAMWATLASDTHDAVVSILLAEYSSLRSLIFRAPCKTHVGNACGKHPPLPLQHAACIKNDRVVPPSKQHILSLVQESLDNTCGQHPPCRLQHVAYRSATSCCPRNLSSVMWRRSHARTACF